MTSMNRGKTSFQMATVQVEKYGARNKKINDMDDDKLRSLVRREVLTTMGYSSFKERFQDIMNKAAQLIYRRVFMKPDGKFHTREEHEALQEEEIYKTLDKA